MRGGDILFPRGLSGMGVMLSKSLLSDLCLVALATIAAAVTRDNFEIVAPRLIALAPYLVITMGVTCFVLPIFGISRSPWRFTSMRDCSLIVAATAIIVLNAVAIGFIVNRLDNIARALPLIQGLLIVSFLVGARLLTRASHDRRVRSVPAHAPSDGVDTILVIGLNRVAELYLECLAEVHSRHVRIAGLLGDGGRVGLSVYSHPVLGTPDQVTSALRRLETHGVFVDRILVAMSRNDLSSAAQDALSRIQETTTIRLEYVAERLGIQSPPTDSTAKALEESARSKIVAGRVPYHRVKRAIDVVASAVLLIVLAPLFLLVGLLVAADVGLPIVFWQQRPGFRDRPFKLYKFRTMADSHDADGKRKPDDERSSVIGNFLRRSRLDELPQLLNILKGEMSFVGPRPLLPVDQPIDRAARLLVRPGLTGWAQIKGGRQISPADKAALDVWYVGNMSLALDIEILLGTVPMLIFGERVTETAIGQAWRDIKLASDTERMVQQEINSRAA
jgi:lipopolysaccharide/colanic/teichoic acid biosynthesis glycosyltransferase